MFYVLVGVVALIVGAILTFWWGPRYLKDIGESQSWLETEGEVVTTRIEDRHDTVERRTEYKAVIEYRYTVDGVTHEGSRWTVGGSRTSPSEGTIQGVLSEYPVGRKVRVYYDPERPDSAVLHRGDAKRAWVVIGLGIVALAIGFLALWKRFA